MMLCNSIKIDSLNQEAIKEYMINLLESQEGQFKDFYDLISQKMGNQIESNVIEEAFIITLRYNVEIHDIVDFVEQFYEEIFIQKQKLDVLKSFQTFDKENTGYVSFFTIQKFFQFSSEQIEIISQDLQFDSEGNFNYYDYIENNL